MSAPPKARRVSRHLEIASPVRVLSVGGCASTYLSTSRTTRGAAQGDCSASQDDVYRTETAEDEARDTDELRNARRSDEQDQYQHHDDELTGPSRRSARLDGDLRGTRRLGTSYATLDAPDEQVGARRSTANGLPVVDVASPTFSCASPTFSCAARALLPRRACLPRTRPHSDDDEISIPVSKSASRDVGSRHGSSPRRR